MKLSLSALAQPIAEWAARFPFTIRIERRYPTYTESQSDQFIAQAVELLGKNAFISNGGLERGKPFLIGVTELHYISLAMYGEWNVFKIYGSGASYEQAFAEAEHAAEPMQHQAYCCKCLERRQYPAPYPWQENVCLVCHESLIESFAHEAKNAQENDDGTFICY